MNRTFETLVTVRVVVRGNEEIEDGITEAELYRVIESIRNACEDLVENELVCFDVHDVECGPVDIMPDVVIDDAPRLVPVPADCWVDWRGHRWATDGCVLIREDVPAPMYNPKDPSRHWRYVNTHGIEEGIGPIFDSVNTSDLAEYPRRKFAGRLSALLKYADCVVGTQDIESPVVLIKNGERVAVIMPLSHEAGNESDKHGKHVDSHGDELA